MKPEELKLIAESVYPQFAATLSDGYVYLWLSDTCDVIYQPITDKAQSWDLMQAYREGLLGASNGWWHDRVLRKMFSALESPETLCQAYLKLIKGEGEAS